MRRFVFTPKQAAVLLALKDIAICPSDIAASTHFRPSEVAEIVRTLEEGKFLRTMTRGSGEDLVQLTHLGKEAQETLMSKSRSVFVAETGYVPASEQDVDQILDSTITGLKMDGL
jgi:DNA-binding MarR family transcriptional regulator